MGEMTIEMFPWFCTQTGTLPSRRTRKVRLFASCTPEFPMYKTSIYYKRIQKNRSDIFQGKTCWDQADTECDTFWNWFHHFWSIADCTCLLSSFALHFWSHSPQRLFCACVSFGRRAQEKVVADLHKWTHPCSAQMQDWLTEVKMCRSMYKSIQILKEKEFWHWWCYGDPRRKLFWISLNKYCFSGLLCIALQRVWPSSNSARQRSTSLTS